VSRALAASGDRWELHRGDVLRLLPELPEGSVDGVVTDPPYSSGGMVRGDRMASTTLKYVQDNKRRDGHFDFSGDTRDQRSFRYWCALWLAECWRVAKPGAPICVFTDWRQLPTTTDAVQAGGWVWRGIVPWDKVNGRPQMGRFDSRAEYVVWGSKGPLPERTEIGCLPGLVSHYQQRDDKHHITGKPVQVMREIVRIVDRDGLVLDPFAGSGTTGVGALLEGRRFLGLALSPEYSEVAAERLQAAEHGLIAKFGTAKAPPNQPALL
jgi:site-specific DNA-methyltransferase (adenine-specific)